jgi:hypothetical protein
MTRFVRFVSRSIGVLPGTVTFMGYISPFIVPCGIWLVVFLATSAVRVRVGPLAH